MIKWHNLFLALFAGVLLLTALPVYAVDMMVGGVRLKKSVKTLSEIKRKNVVFQSLDYSCGAAGLSTLFNFYLNKTTNENSVINALFQITPQQKVVERRGFSLLDLKKLVETVGFKATGYKMDMAFLRDLHAPVLVPIEFRKFKHFVIVKAVIADRVFISDPATGNVSMKIDQFEKMWTSGIGLVVEDPAHPGYQSEAMKISSRDFLVYDYKRMQSLLLNSVLRASLNPAEF